MKSVITDRTTVVTTVILPVNESITMVAGPLKATLKKFAPKSGAPGSKLTLHGTNLSPVGSVVVGGVQAALVSESTKKVVVTVPPGATTELVTLIGMSGDVTSTSAFKVT